MYEQGCIPVGCVPSAAVAVSGGGVSAPWGVYLVPGGAPGPGGGGVSARGWVGCGFPACTEADTPTPPVDRQTPVKT